MNTYPTSIDTQKTVDTYDFEDANTSDTFSKNWSKFTSNKCFNDDETFDELERRKEESSHIEAKRGIYGRKESLSMYCMTPGKPTLNGCKSPTITWDFLKLPWLHLCLIPTYDAYQASF